MESNTDMIMGMIVMPVMFVTIGFVFKMFMDAKKNKLKMELHQKLVEKFNNVSELNDFLKSDSGSKFLQSLSIEYVQPKERIISSITRGLVAGVVGLSFLPIGMMFSGNSKYYYAAGIVLFALGVSLLISSWLSYKLSAKWGIIKDVESM